MSMMASKKIALESSEVGRTVPKGNIRTLECLLYVSSPPSSFLGYPAGTFTIPAKSVLPHSSAPVAAVT